MGTSAITGASTASSGSQTDTTMSAFRQADFLKIMLTEISNQSPLDPQDTGTLVENMRKLQDLANTTYTKFRNDVRWAQDIMGKPVNVQQQSIDAVTAQKQRDKGLVPDVGYGSANGTVDSFKVVDNAVYVTVNGKDYPVDNIKQVLPESSAEQTGGQGLQEAANAVLGRKVRFHREKLSDEGTGTVTGVGYSPTGNVVLSVGTEYVPYENVTAIGVPQ